VVLNKIALSIVEEVRGQHPELVFTYNGRPLTRILNILQRKLVILLPQWMRFVK